MIARLFALWTLFFCIATMQAADARPTYSEWLKTSGERLDANTFPPVSSETPRVVPANVLRWVRWALGEAPRHNASVGSRALPPAMNGNGIITFGEGVTGRLDFPKTSGNTPQKFPVCIWLNPFHEEPPPIAMFVQAGFAVLTFDQVGSGSRQSEAKNFYAAHPHWSLLGKMVDDTRASLVALSSIASVETNRIWLVGFDRGALLALHAAVLDSRVCGVAVIGGLSPMRPSLANRGEPTFAKAQRSFPLLPRFGAFAGHEDRLPYDYRELVEVIAPRPVLMLTGLDENGLDANDLGRVYTPMKHVSYRVIEHSHGFPPNAQQILIGELKRAAAR